MSDNWRQSARDGDLVKAAVEACRMGVLAVYDGPETLTFGESECIIDQVTFAGVCGGCIRARAFRVRNIRIRFSEGLLR